MTIAASGSTSIALVGVLIGAALTAVLGPFMVQRAARLETYRNWQAELAGEFLKQLAAVRGALEELRLGPDDNATKKKTSELIEELNVLALRVELVFRRTMRREDFGPPAVALNVVQHAKEALAKPLDADPGHARLDDARAEFVRLASNQIRGRWWRKDEKVEESQDENSVTA